MTAKNDTAHGTGAPTRECVAARTARRSHPNDTASPPSRERPPGVHVCGQRVHRRLRHQRRSGPAGHREHRDDGSHGRAGRQGHRAHHGRADDSQSVMTSIDLREPRVMETPPMSAPIAPPQVERHDARARHRRTEPGARRRRRNPAEHQIDGEQAKKAAHSASVSEVGREQRPNRHTHNRGQRDRRTSCRRPRHSPCAAAITRLRPTRCGVPRQVSRRLGQEPRRRHGRRKRHQTADQNSVRHRRPARRVSPRAPRASPQAGHAHK